MFDALKSFIKQRLYQRLGLVYPANEIPISLLKHLRKDKPIVLIDIGAHDGEFTKSLANYCGISRGLLIEPLPYKICKLNQFFTAPEYAVVECVLSAKAENVDFEVNEFDATSSMLSIKRTMPELAGINLGEPKTVRLEARTLDEVAFNVGLKDIDLIKIDVQGAEHLVILGARETLKKTKMIWTEVSFKPLYKGSSDFKYIYTLLNESDFRLVDLEPGFRAPDGELLQGDALFVKL